MVDINDAGTFWPSESDLAPKPLRDPQGAQPFPLEALPPLLQAAVSEVASYVQAPVALIAGCALSVVSACVQVKYDVRRDAALVGPISLFFLTVAQSGERKSTVDRLFMKPIRDWEAEQGKALKARKEVFKEALRVWETRRAELQKEKEQYGNGVSGDDLSTLVDPLVLHEASRPQEPRPTAILRGDDTPEALAAHLAIYPVAAVVTAESGSIFGSPGMNPESVTRNLAQVNLLWDGGPIDQGRITRERIRIENVRVTMGLQVQPAVLQGFMEKTGGLARGIGYLARFLFSEPASTQGGRLYRSPPDRMPALDAFHRRVRYLLGSPASFDELDRLERHEVPLDPDAMTIWAAFHDEVEQQLGRDGQFVGIRDVASKAAENAVRLSACLHIFSGDPAWSITASTMRVGCTLMRWYLGEARRFALAEELTTEMRNAEMLEQWLIKQMATQESVAVNDVRQKGPNKLRTRKILDAALELLQDHGRITIVQPEGTKRRIIEVAPEVLRADAKRP